MKLKVTFNIDVKGEHFLEWCKKFVDGKIMSTELGELVKIIFTDPNFDAEGSFTTAQFVMNEPVEDHRNG